MALISIQNVTKKYGNYTALKGISFEVKKGEIVGLLGPNGAGKSTTMNIITGYISATSGTVTIDGTDILKDPINAKKKIGYLPEIPPVYGDMTVEEYLLFVARLKKTPKSKLREQVEKIITLISLSDVRKRLIKNLSKGYRQRVGLGQAIIGDPEVLILDEPTVGLDPKQIIEMRNLITSLSKNHTIILSSHILSEISAVCDRMIIINKGEVVAEGTTDELSKRLSYSNKLLLRVKGTPEAVDGALKDANNIESITDKKIIEAGTVDFIVESKKDIDIREELFNIFSKENMPILMMKPHDLSLEEIFLEVTENNKEVTPDARNIQ